MRTESTRPGVMLYFDDFKAITGFLTNEQVGILVKAILSYAETGEWVSADCDTNVHFALSTLRSKIDRDGERYQRSVLQRRHAVYVREAQKRGTEPLSFEEWLALEEARQHRSVSTDNER